MKRHVQQLWIFIVCWMLAALPASAQSVPLHQDAREFFPTFFRNTAQAIDEQIKDKTQFVEEFFDYKKGVDNRLGEVLGDLTVMIRNFAEDKGGLLESCNRLNEDLERFSDKFHPIADDFPQADEVERIIKPGMNNLTAVLEREFPVLGPMPAEGFPLGHFYNFFQEAERRNSFGMGAFFRVEPLRPFSVRRTYVSKIRYVNQAGLESEEVLFEESHTYENGEEVEHRLVENDEVLINEKRTADFSFLHGMPKAMRQDGVNERFIVLVEEYIKLVNFYLIENYRERGLMIPADHPQLVVPDGYTPQTFVNNFISLILAFQTPGSPSQSRP